jgi:hypothetical protein
VVDAIVISFCLQPRRGTWHFRDHVPILRRLKWGSFGFANLRFAPGTRLEWACGNNTDDPNFKPFDCNWVGGVMNMTGMGPRKANVVNVMNKDEWGDSIELISVIPQLLPYQLASTDMLQLILAHSTCGCICPLFV